MPVEFLSDEQADAYGRFTGSPTQEQLERFFWLNDADRERVGRRRQETTTLGFAVQVGTVRFLGTFLDDPVDVPWAVVAFVGGQLGRPARGACRWRKPAPVRCRRAAGDKAEHAGPELKVGSPFTSTSDTTSMDATLGEREVIGGVSR